MISCTGLILATCFATSSLAQITEAQAYLLAHGNDETVAMSGGQWVGNGGDPLTQIFEQARRDSIEMVSMLDLLLVFPVSGSAQNFLHDVRTRFLQSLRESPHHWVQPPKDSMIKIQPTCARTNIDFPGINPKSIWLALHLCRSSLAGLNAGNLAIKLLLHETVHHFASDAQWGSAAASEDFADEVAEFLLLAWNYQRSLAGPSYQKLSVPQQSPRFGHSALVKRDVKGMQDRIYIWGGCADEDALKENHCLQALGNGFAIQPAALGNEWLSSPIAAQGAPSPRFHHVAFWAEVRDATGQLREAMVIHGGCALQTEQINSGLCPTVLGDTFAYFPETNSWLELKAQGERIEPRSEFASVPIENGLAIHGGLNDENGSYRNDGYLLEFIQGKLMTRRILPQGKAKDSVGRKEHSLVWTGEEFIIWGGCEKQVLGCRYVNHGFAYNLRLDTWRVIAAIGAPSPRKLHGAIRIGPLMLIWGGIHSSGNLFDGALFDPITMTWRLIPKIPFAVDSPSERPLLAWDDSQSRLTVFLTGSSKIHSPSMSPQFLRWSGLEKDESHWQSELLDFAPTTIQPGARALHSIDNYYLLGGKWPPEEFAIQSIHLP
jgi:hypothetical protein